MAFVNCGDQMTFTCNELEAALRRAGLLPANCELVQGCEVQPPDAGGWVLILDTQMKTTP